MGNCRSLYTTISKEYTIFLKNRFGGIIPITAHNDDSVYIIKQKLLICLNYRFMNESNIRLFHNGLLLKNAELIKTYNITNKMSLHYSITMDPLEKESISTNPGEDSVFSLSPTRTLPV
jgi:hypothetical protein